MSHNGGKSFWGIGIAAINIGFVLFILALVLYASIQDRQLVEDSYYEHGLAYQDRIDRMKRSRDLKFGFNIQHRYDEQEIVLSLPQFDSTTECHGTIQLIRPSNARLDRTLSLIMDSSGCQVISTQGMTKGLWRIYVDWGIDSVGYYDESRIVIP